MAALVGSMMLAASGGAVDQYAFTRTGDGLVRFQFVVAGSFELVVGIDQGILSAAVFDPTGLLRWVDTGTPEEPAYFQIQPAGTGIWRLELDPSIALATANGVLTCWPDCLYLEN